MKETLTRPSPPPVSGEATPRAEHPANSPAWKGILPALIALAWVGPVIGLALVHHDRSRELLANLLPAPLLLLALAWGALGLGRRILSLWASRSGCRDELETMPALERHLHALALGLGATCLIIFGLGAVGLFRPAVGWGLLAVLVASAGWPLPRLRELLGDIARAKPATLPERLAAGLLFVVGGITFLSALTPVISQDALVYHLAAPEIYLREGGLTFIPGNFYASFPENAEMLFTLALLLEQESLANLVHWLFGLGSVLAIVQVTRHATGGRGGSLAACLFATVPTVALISSWAYVDLALVFFQMMAILAFLRWAGPPGDRRTGLLVLAALHVGLAAGCKYTGGAIGVVLGAGLVISGLARSRPRREILREFSILGFVSLAVVSPWYLKNLILTGNPLYPFLYGLFGGRDWDAGRAETMSIYFKNFGGDSSPIGLLKLPWRLTYEADFSTIDRFDGVLGAGFLIGLPCLLLAIRGRRPVQLLLFFTVAFLGIWMVTTRQMRFLVPSLAIFAVVIAAVVISLESAWARRAMVTGLAAAFILNVALMSLRFASHSPLPVAFGLESEDEFREREIACGDYPVFAYLDERLPPDAHVFLAAAGNPGYLVKRSYHMEALFENHRLRQMLLAAETPAGLLESFREQGFTHLLFRQELVFDPSGLKSGLDRPEQVLLMEMLNRHATLLTATNGTFLYELGVEGDSP